MNEWNTIDKNYTPLYRNKFANGSIVIIAWIYTILLFTASVTILFRGPMLFLQEFTKSAKGKVEKVEMVHGGYDIFLSSREDFYWILSTPPPVAGDRFTKEMNSFRYMINSKNRTSKKEIMMLTSFPILYPYSFVLLGIMLIFQTVFYKIHEKSPPVAFLESFHQKVYKKQASTITMYILPVLFIWYIIYFFVIDIFL